MLLFRKWQETVAGEGPVEPITDAPGSRWRTGAGTPYDPEAAIALLRNWAETTDPEEIQDQKGTMALLRKELNRGRPKGYEIFP